MEFCKRTGVKIPDIARAAGLDEKWLYKVAKGQVGFSLETAEKIEKATGGAVTLNALNKVRREWKAANPEAAQAQKKSAALEGAA